ncbi:hypothetical protein [Streptomyces capitiformicae]|nr:hypothetical protein [Streptomyces capitiformicae]
MQPLATDIAWTRGRGEEASGPVGALLLLLTGRTYAAVPHLPGPVPAGN